MKIFLLLFFSLKILFLKAQYEPNIGYYIIKNNDTINALFKDKPQKKLTHQISCFDSTNKSWTNLYPDQIVKFYIPQGERLYESMRFVMANKDTNVFLRCLVNGYLSLYSLEMDSKPEFFLKDTTESLMKLEYSENITNQYINVKKKYVGQLTYAMKDYPEIFEEINKTEYKKKDLIQLFENYNRLSENNYKVYYKSRVEILKNIQVGGLFTSDLKTFFGSFYGEIYNPDFSQNSSLHIGLNYSQVYKYSLLHEEHYYSKFCVNGNCTEYYDTLKYNYQENFKVFSITYLYQYKYYNKICVPYLYTGLSIAMYSYNKIADLPEYSESIKNDFGLLFVFGIGLERRIINKIFIYVDYRKEIIGRTNIGIKYRF